MATVKAEIAWAEGEGLVEVDGMLRIVRQDGRTLHLERRSGRDALGVPQWARVAVASASRSGARGSYEDGDDAADSLTTDLVRLLVREADRRRAAEVLRAGSAAAERLPFGLVKTEL